MFKKLLITILVMLSLGVMSAQYSHGKEYPTRPIEILVTYPPGGTSDLVARQVAEVAKKYLGQPLVVVNRGGGGGTVGVSEFVNSKPDGYRIAYLPSSYFATTIRTQKIPFDPNHIMPLINFVEVRQGLIVRTDSPWKTLDQLLDYARQNPGKLRWNHAGRGIGQHICQMIIFKRAGVETNDIPYKSSPEQVAALLGGHVDASAMVYVTVKEHVRAGKVRFLVTHSTRRYTDTPNVPCAAELGFPDQVLTFSGIHVLKDTPEDIKKTLFEAFKKTQGDPELMKGIAMIGEEPRFEGPEFIKESIKEAITVGVPVLKELGLYDSIWDNK